GLLQDAERMYYVAQQVKSILYSVFAWQEGEYVMTFHSKARHEPIRLGIHPAQLISRGIKKLYSPARQQRMLAKTDRLIPSEDPAFQLTEIELEPWEAHLLSRIDGNRDVAALVALADRPEAEVYSTLVTLLALKIVEKRG
ncbi:MAG TPA: two-component system response regulator, partial [Vulgatibacter sp.]|nr:two-component system response regulator [Vulgatibacter sp.]